MGNHEILKGQTDGIILFILSKSNRHTDELKQIIDEKFSTVKIGTLYSVITRLKTQKLISEYRASSLDGSRRKYYQLTDYDINEINNLSIGADAFYNVKEYAEQYFEFLETAFAAGRSIPYVSSVVYYVDPAGGEYSLENKMGYIKASTPFANIAKLIEEVTLVKP